MRSNSGFSLRSALSDGVGFIPRGVASAWAALGLFWLAAVAWEQVLIFLYSDYTPAIRSALLLVIAVTGLMAEGALYRTALFAAYAKPEGLGWGGLQFAKPELRLIGAGFLVLIFMVFIAAILSLLLALGLNMAGLMTPEMTLPYDLVRYHGKATIAVVAATAFIAIFLLYLGFRLSLYKPATIATHQVVSLNALSLSEGKAFKLFLGVFLLSLPVIIVIGIVMNAKGTSAHQVLWQIGLCERPRPCFPLHLSLIGQAILKAVAIFLVIPAVIGFLSSAYRQTVELRAKQ